MKCDLWALQCHGFTAIRKKLHTRNPHYPILATERSFDEPGNAGGNFSRNERILSRFSAKGLEKSPQLTVASDDEART
jgi:hypothetical protein